MAKIDNKDMPPVVEIFPIVPVFCSGLGAVFFEKGLVNLEFYVTQRDSAEEGASLQRVMCLRLIMPVDAIDACNAMVRQELAAYALRQGKDEEPFG